MTGIVERLHGHPGEGMTVTEQFRNMVEQRHEAADEIERLRAALQQIIERYGNSEEGWPAEDMRTIARRALDDGLPTANDVRGIMREPKP